MRKRDRESRPNTGSVSRTGSSRGPLSTRRERVSRKRVTKPFRVVGLCRTNRRDTDVGVRRDPRPSSLGRPPVPSHNEWGPHRTRGVRVVHPNPHGVTKLNRRSTTSEIVELHGFDLSRVPSSRVRVGTNLPLRFRDSLPPRPGSYVTIESEHHRNQGRHT